MHERTQSASNADMTIAVVGVDPGTRRAGAALVVDGEAAGIWGWTLRGRAVDIGAALEELRARVVAVVGTARVLAPAADVVLAVEATTWRISARQQAAAGATMGVVEQVGAITSARVIRVAPAAAKLALAGHGRATKADMLRAALAAVGSSPELEGAARHDAADALGVALAGYGMLRVEALERRRRRT